MSEVPPPPHRRRAHTSTRDLERYAGLFAERWVHTHGCRQWFHVLRDTLTHEISATCRIDETLPRPEGKR